jgi:hypothetical protein
MAYMYRLLRGTILGQEVQCLKVLGLRLRDHAVVVSCVVQVMINMTLDLTVVAFSLTVLADHVFPHMVPTFLKWDMACLVFFLALFQGKCANIGILHSFINPNVTPFTLPMFFY